ncbi:hypothetical protein DL95DRAFT_518219 [Leptodontidium sp. 2 PMI_412]|nr:hypothetical protein DL95DRAFT_518219 [Leptodontidium sp. 2 PMI_412]
MYISYPADKLRPILHGYFIIAFLLLGILGDECLKKYLKSSLSRNRSTRLNYMTGFLSGWTFISSAWDLRAIPGGLLLGPAMLLATILSPLTTLIIGALVKDVQISSRCSFPQGMVLHPSGPFTFTEPPVNGRPKLEASNTQIIINTAPNFQAQTQDVLASWVCTDVNDDLTFQPATSPGQIITTLQNKGYQYGNTSNISLGPSLGYEHLVIWSPSDTFTPWDVRASISLNAQPTDDMVIRSFHCAVDNHAADQILTSMDSHWCMSDWIQGFQGGCYDGSGTPAIAGAAIFIEQYLNAMLMVQAGNNNLLQSVPAGSDPTQGCLVTKASVPVEIFALVGVVGLLVLVTLLAWLVLLVVGCCAGKKVKGMRDVLGYVPVSLTGWMLHAARESGARDARERAKVVTEARELRQWRYGVDDEGVGRPMARLLREAA